MVTLRPIAIGDAAAVASAVHRSRAALQRWMSWYRDDYDSDLAAEWIRQSIDAAAAGTDFHFAILDATDTLVGIIGFEDVSHDSRRAMLGYWLATDATGRGIGRQAIALALDWARRHTTLRVIWAVVAEQNRASRRVLEVNGFRMVETRGVDERGDTALIYEAELSTPSPNGLPRDES